MNFLWNAADYLGVWGKKYRLLVFGLENAGKTSLLNIIKDKAFDSKKSVLPTTQPIHFDELKFGGFRFQAYDFPGGPDVQKFESYFDAADCVLYVVDSSDPAKFVEAKKQISFLLKHPKLVKTPIGVLANKSDLEEAKNEHFLSRVLFEEVLEKKEVKEEDEDLKEEERLYLGSILRRRSGIKDVFRWFKRKLEPFSEVKVVTDK
jgi:GTP-binding protein SAR1